VNRQALKGSSPSSRIARGMPRNLTEYLQLPPRWRTLMAGFVFIFGLMLFCGAIADSFGTLQPPGVGATVLMVVMVVTASLLVYFDRRVSKRK
jgi:hypothetical protein